MVPNILLVDVDSPERNDWKAFLENQGFEIVVAVDGDEAVAKCRDAGPDLVLLHDTLPDIGSCDLCAKLKADPLNSLTPVVIVSAFGASDSWRGREAGADDFWGLPTSRWEAFSRVQSLLQMKAYIDEQAKSVVLSLAQSIGARDPLKAGHSERLVSYAVELGKRLDLPADELEELRFASLIHDVGKVAVPDAIISKPGPLTAEERKIMNQHPVTGESICAPLKSLRRVLPVIRHHHERMDGSGYPDGLRGERIPLKARILQIADIYDALTSDRPYRDALPPEEAHAVLMREARVGWLDPFLVREFAGIREMTPHIVPTGRSMLSSYYV